LRRLASSLPAFRAALIRHEAYLGLAIRAATEGRALTPREFQRCFPRAAESDIQLVLFPLLLERPASNGARLEDDRRVLDRLRELLKRAPPTDPKADALDRLLTARPAKTIVFTDAQPTARYLMQRFRHRRVAAVFGHVGRFAAGDAARRDVLRTFAPRAQGAPLPPAALETDVLIATDLLSEGLNLQDAARVVHYDLPWSPARLAQRVGRIDRLGSSHSAISTVTFLPPAPLAGALAIEERLATKVGAQQAAGTNGRLDWCDQLALLATPDSGAPGGSCAAVVGEPGVVLVVRICEPGRGDPHRRRCRAREPRCRYTDTGSGGDCAVHPLRPRLAAAGHRRRCAAHPVTTRRCSGRPLARERSRPVCAPPDSVGLVGRPARGPPRRWRAARRARCVGVTARVGDDGR